MAEDLVPGGSHPDVLNTCWREYGNRVGAWRLLDLFAHYRLPVGVLLNSAVCDHAPALVEAYRSAGHELIAHGRSNSESLAGMTDEQQATYVTAVAKRMAEAGQAPRGWAGPWMAETPDHARRPCRAAGGIGYILDWGMDDQPVWMATQHGRILSVPYSQELNDSSAIIGRQVSAADFSDMIIDQFDEMLATVEDGRPVVMSVVLHAFIIGQPFRMRQLRRALDHILAPRPEVWIARPGEIADNFRNLVGTIV